MEEINKKKFKKAEIRSKSNKPGKTKHKYSSVNNKRKTSSAKRKNSNAINKRPQTPINIKINAIDHKYAGISTPTKPTTPKRNYTRLSTSKPPKIPLNNNNNKRRESNLPQVKHEEASQHVEYLKMQKLYRMLKKDLKKLKSDSKALEIEKRRITKDQKKLLRDKEQFEISARTANLKRENAGNKGKYTILEEDKLRKMLYAERKQWNEERKNLRSEILRLEGEFGNIRHLNNSQRNSLLKIPENIKKNESKNNSKNVGPMEKQNYSRQQKEFQRFIRIEKQKAMNDIEIEKKKLAMLAKQLRADHDILKKQQATHRNKNKWTPKQRVMNPKIFIDKTVKKIYIDPKHRRPYERKGDVIKYKPKKTRIVYRDLRKKIVLRTHEWDTKIKYLNHKGKELNHIKKRIVTLEDKIGKKVGKKKKKYINGMTMGMDTSGMQVEESTSTSDSDDGKLMPMAMETEVMQEADAELANALEELDGLQSEYMSIEQDMETTVEELQQGEVNEDEFEEQKQKMELAQFEKETPQLRFQLMGSNNYNDQKSEELELKDERVNNYRNVKKPSLDDQLKLPRFELKGSNNFRTRSGHGVLQDDDTGSTAPKPSPGPNEKVLRLGDVNNYRNKKQSENENEYTNNYRNIKNNGSDDLVDSRDNNYRNIKNDNENEDHGLFVQNEHVQIENDMSDAAFELELQKIQQSELRKGNMNTDPFQLENDNEQEDIEVTKEIDMEEALAQIEMSPSAPMPDDTCTQTPLSLQYNTNDQEPEIDGDGIITTDDFEHELLKLERALTITTHPTFEKHVSHMEQIVTEQAEEAGTLRQVIESLSERLAGAQLEIDSLKDQIRAAKRRQKLRDLYMRMAYSDLPEYKLMQSADDVGYYNRKSKIDSDEKFGHEENNSFLNVHNGGYGGGNMVNNKKGKKKQKQVKFSDSGMRMTATNDNSGEMYGKNGMRINNNIGEQQQFSNSGMNITKTNDKLNIQILDNDGNEVLDIDKAMNILFNPFDYSPAMIIKGTKAVYANGLIDDRRDYMSGNNIIKALLDIIQYNGKLVTTNADSLPIIKAALKALIPMLDNGKCKIDFFKHDGIDIFDNLFGPNIDSLQHMYPISALIAEAIGKIMVDDLNENDKLKIDDIMIKLCHILNKTYMNDKGKKLLTHFGEILEQMDHENQINLMKPLIDAGILNITTSCALASVNASDHKGVCDTFGLCYDHIAEVDGFLHGNSNVNIDDLIDAIDLYSQENTADVLTHVLDGILAMILNDKNSKNLVKQFKDKGLEHVLIRALNNVKNSMNIFEDDEKYNGNGYELNVKFDSNDLNNPIIECIADFYNTLQFEKLKPKMSQLKVKLNEFGVALYGTEEWIHSQNPNNDIYNNSNNPLSPQGKILEDLYIESKYEFDENDAMQMCKNRINKRITHPKLSDMGAFLSRIGKQNEKKDIDEYNTQQMVIMKKQTNNNENNKTESKMSKLFGGMFRNKKKNDNENNKNFQSEKSTIRLKLDRFNSVMDAISSPKSKNQNQNLFIQNNNNNNSNIKLPSKPNKIFQQQRMFLKKYDKNGRKRIPTYDDFMNEAFNNRIGRGLNEVQSIYNEMSHHTGLIKPVGSMLQKWYVLANHGTQYWISPTNKELSKYNSSHSDYYDMNDDEKFNDCWLLYDMKRKRMIQEIRWKNRGLQNDPKYITIQCANNESTPWTDISNAYLEKTNDEQIIKINKKSRYWRILFLGNHGEYNNDAPRFVFYEVQFWGRRHSTMNYSKAATIRKMKKQRSRTGTASSNLLSSPNKYNKNNRSNSVSKSHSKSKSNRSNPSNQSRIKQYKIGYGDNAKKGKKYKNSYSSNNPLTIEMTGKSKFTTLPL